MVERFSDPGAGAFTYVSYEFIMVVNGFFGKGDTTLSHSYIVTPFVPHRTVVDNSQLASTYLLDLKYF
jgi:hypothetical protein